MSNLNVGQKLYFRYTDLGGSPIEAAITKIDRFNVYTSHIWGRPKAPAKFVISSIQTGKIEEGVRYDAFTDLRVRENYLKYEALVDKKIPKEKLKQARKELIGE